MSISEVINTPQFRERLRKEVVRMHSAYMDEREFYGVSVAKQLMQEDRLTVDGLSDEYRNVMDGKSRLTSFGRSFILRTCNDCFMWAVRQMMAEEEKSNEA